MSDAPLWGVGQYDDGVHRVAWPITHDEIQRDMGSAARITGEFGLGAGDRVLFCSMLSEAGQFWPLVVATMLSGAQLSCADATAGEAVRVAMFLRLMEYRAIFGVNEAILDGLDDLGPTYADTFRGVEILGARPGAYERLVAAGLTPHRFALAGPVVAIGRAPGSPALADGSEWELGVDAGHVTVTNLRPRATQFAGARTGLRGHLVDGGIVPAAVASIEG